MLTLGMSEVEQTPIDTQPPAITRERILDATEQLLAEHGVAGTSVRAITTLADVNVAAVNYHFGSKDKLVRAVITRRFDELEAARHAGLDNVEAVMAREGRPPETLELVEALLGPAFTQAGSEDSGWANFVRFVSRLSWEPGAEQLEPSVEAQRLYARFENLLCRAVPTLKGDPDKRLWRMAFMRGASQHALLMMSAIRAKRVPTGVMLSGLTDTVDIETIKRELFAFCAAGLEAKT